MDNDKNKLSDATFNEEAEGRTPDSHAERRHIGPHEQQFDEMADRDADFIRRVRERLQKTKLRRAAERDRTNDFGRTR